MRKSLMNAVLIYAALSFAAQFAAASQALRIVSELDSQSANFAIENKGDNGAELKLDIPLIASNTIVMNNKEYKEVHLPAADHLFDSEIAEDGFPDIPAVSTFMAIPDGAGIRLTVNYSGFDEIDDIELAPVQPSPCEGDAPVEIPFTLNEDIYSRDSYFPGPLAEASEPIIMRDIRAVQITIYPAQYNPVSRTLRIYRDLSVAIAYDGEVINPKTTHRSYISDAFYPVYKSTFANFEQLYSTAEIRRGGLMIISKPIFVDSLADLAQWKHRKGYSVEVVSTFEIYPDGDPTNIQIFNFIRDAYQSWDPPPEYVMIIGDEDNLANTGVADFPYDTYYASDHHYATVEGTDYIPDLMISRVSVDNMTEFRKAKAKILAYDRNPYMGDPEHWIRGLSVGGNVYATTPRITVLWVRQLLLGLGFASVDTSFRWASGETDPNLQGYFNNGVSFISYRGWSGSSGWYSPQFQISNLNSMPNSNKLGFMASVACGTGDFADECFGETWIKMGASPISLKGGPIFYGSSDHSGHTRWNNPMMIGLIWGMLHGGAYHFGQAIITSKMQIYRTYPHYLAPGSYVEQYINTFNGLGDPEIEVRTAIPKGLMVAHPESLSLGSNLVEIAVTDSSGIAIDNSFVTLQKGYEDNEEVFESGRTDASGHVFFKFQASTADTMFVTVSGQNLYPYQGHIIISQADLSLGPDSLIIDDDSLGLSIGNGDGVANPGEIIELRISLKNFGTLLTASGISSALEAIDTDLVSVFDSERGFPDIQPGQSAFSSFPYIIKIENAVPAESSVRMRLIIADTLGNQWNSAVVMETISPVFRITAIAFDDDDSVLNPGDSIGMILSISNLGDNNAPGANLSISTRDDYTRVENRNVYLGDILADSVVSNIDDPIMIVSDGETFNGRTIELLAALTTSDGYSAILPLTIDSGIKNVSDPVGPASYGYFMYDDIDTSYQPHPTYDWVEIVPSLGGLGTRLNFEELRDDNSVMVEMPFDLVYYSEHFNKIIVSLNGVISPDTTRFDMEGHFWYNFFNWPIPDPATARAQISAFWDDIAFIGSTYGVYVWTDTINHRYIIEWYHMYHRNTSAFETFEIIIEDPTYHPTITGDSEIIFQYSQIQNNDSEECYSTIGFENWAQTDGIQYEYDNYYASGAALLGNGRAIKITTNTGRGAIRGIVDLDNGGHNGGVMVLVSSGQFRLTSPAGNFWIKDIPPGIMDFRAQTHGYFPYIINNVNIESDQTMEGGNLELRKCPIPENLAASDTCSDRISLFWDHIDDSNLNGYNVYRSRWADGEYSKLNAEPLQINHYIDIAIPDSGTYWYYVTAAYGGDSWTTESFGSIPDQGLACAATNDISPDAIIPERFALYQNYPNPFNPATSIKFDLARDSRAKVEIFDILGRKLYTLMDNVFQAGSHEIIWNAAGIPSGVYFYKMTTEDFSETKKMLLLK